MNRLELFIDEWPFVSTMTNDLFCKNFSRKEYNRVERVKTDNILSIKVNLAGVKKDQIQTSMEGNALKIEVDGELKNMVAIDYGFKPKDASYENGMLIVNFERKKKEISID